MMIARRPRPAILCNISPKACYYGGFKSLFNAHCSGSSLAEQAEKMEGIRGMPTSTYYGPQSFLVLVLSVVHSRCRFHSFPTFSHGLPHGSYNSFVFYHPLRAFCFCLSVICFYFSFNMRSASGPAAVRGRITSSSECVDPPF